MIKLEHVLTLLHWCNHLGTGVEEIDEDAHDRIVESSKSLGTKVQHVVWNSQSKLLFITDNNGM